MNDASKQATATYCLSINGANTAAYSNFYTFSEIQSAQSLSFWVKPNI